MIAVVDSEVSARQLVAADTEDLVMGAVLSFVTLTAGRMHSFETSTHRSGVHAIQTKEYDHARSTLGAHVPG